MVGDAAVHAAGGQVGSGFEDGILVRSLLLLLPLQGREQQQVSEPISHREHSTEFHFPPQDTQQCSVTCHAMD